jgi:predicted PurR-regulated permease PerM
VIRDPEKSFGNDGAAISFIELAIKLGTLGLLLYWSFLLIRPFISIVIWSSVLAAALYPTFEWTSSQLGGRRRLAAALITILSLLIIIGPATWLALGLVESLRTISERLDLSTLTIPSPSSSVKSWPLIGKPIYDFGSSHQPTRTRPLTKLFLNLPRWAKTYFVLARTLAWVLSSFSFLSWLPDFFFAPHQQLLTRSKCFRAGSIQRTAKSL